MNVCMCVCMYACVRVCECVSVCLYVLNISGGGPAGRVSVRAGSGHVAHTVLAARVEKREASSLSLSLQVTGT